MKIYIGRIDEKAIRKIQFVGGSTYTLSLPKKWVDELNLKTGDPVFIIKNANKSLSILSAEISQSKIAKSKAVISQKEVAESIQCKVIAMYLAGYQIIEIQSKEGKIQLKHKEAIRDLVRRNMVGTEIVESTSESIKIQILTSLAELSVNDAMKRMLILTITMHRQVIDALRGMDTELGEEITHLDDEVDRFSLYILRNLTLAVDYERILHDIGLKKPSDCISYIIVVRLIERVADNAVSIASGVKFLKSTLEPALLQKVTKLSEESLKVFEDSIAALNKRDYALADMVASNAHRTMQKEQEFTDSLGESKMYTGVIKFVLENIRRTTEYSSDIAGTVINETVQDIVSESYS